MVLRVLVDVKNILTTENNALRLSVLASRDAGWNCNETGLALLLNGFMSKSHTRFACSRISSFFVEKRMQTIFKKSLSPNKHCVGVRVCCIQLSLKIGYVRCF